MLGWWLCCLFKVVLGQATSGDPRGLPLIHYCLFEHPAFISFVWLILVVLKPGPHDLLFNELKIFSGSMRSSLVSYLKILDPAPPQKIRSKRKCVYLSPDFSKLSLCSCESMTLDRQVLDSGFFKPVWPQNFLRSILRFYGIFFGKNWKFTEVFRGLGGGLYIKLIGLLLGIYNIPATFRNLLLLDRNYYYIDPCEKLNKNSDS